MYGGDDALKTAKHRPCVDIDRLLNNGQPFYCCSQLFYF